MYWKFARLIAVVTGMAAAQAALAADLPADMPVKAPPAQVVAYNWSGLYFGAHAGYGWTNAHWTTNDHAAGNLEFNSQRPRGWVGGGQLGIRSQTGNFVWGIEGTLSVTGLDKRDPACGVGMGPLPCTSPLVTVAPGVREDRTTKIQNIATITGQLGYAWNNALLYAKGGWAFAGYRMENDVIDTTTGTSFCNVAGTISCAKSTRRADGPTAGAGLEYGLTPNVSVGVEYDYIHLRGGNVTVAATTGAVSTFSDIRADIHQVLARINFRFTGNWWQS